MMITFHTERKYSTILGESIWIPAAIVEIFGRGEFVPYKMLVDSGSDITLITRLMGDYLGLEIEKEDIIRDLTGLTGESIPAIIKKMKMKIGEIEFVARVAWTMTEEVPLLLGRLDVFKKFDIEFKEEAGNVIFKLKQ